jgi:hypothetical protein
MVFNSTIYHVSKHAIEQTIRSGVELEESEIKRMAEEGTVIFESPPHRYIRYKNIRLPCVDKGNGEYVIKSFIPTTMRMRLIENNHTSKESD